MSDFGFDDCGFVDEVLGMDLMDDGLMNYEEGVILTQMGMPGLGMAQMQLGQMEMAEGQALMEVGMMENAIGMGYGGAAYICMGVGCRYPCCVRKRCLPGCMLSCCRKQVIVVTNNNQQYTKPAYINQRNYNQISGQNQISNQMNQQQEKPIFTGSLYRQQFQTWHLSQNAMVTFQHFVNQPLTSIIKLKVKKEILHNDCFFLKTSHFNSSDKYYAVPRHQQVNWFCSIIWAKLQLQRYGCDIYRQFNGFIEGRLLRKSKFLGEWAFRDVVIDLQGLKSYKSRNQLPTTQIHRIRELWTRFQIIDQHKYLVIKLHYQGTKFEYGIALNDAIHWIRAFFSLMR